MSEQEDGRAGEENESPAAALTAAEGECTLIAPLSDQRPI